MKVKYIGDLGDHWNCKVLCKNMIVEVRECTEGYVYEEMGQNYLIPFDDAILPGDQINSSHYQNGSVEVWEMMVRIWGEEAFKNYCELNAFKYRMRAGTKEGNPVEQDIEKAKWYEEKLAKLNSNG